MRQNIHTFMTLKKIPQNDIISIGDILFYDSEYHNSDNYNMPMIVCEIIINKFHVRYFSIFDKEHIKTLLSKGRFIKYDSEKITSK